MTRAKHVVRLGLVPPPRSDGAVGDDRGAVHAVYTASRPDKELTLVLANYGTAVCIAADLGILRFRLYSKPRTAQLQRHAMGERHSKRGDPLVQSRLCALTV